MVFTLEHHDPETYRRKARMISFAMAGQLIILASCSQCSLPPPLAAAYGSMP